MKYLLVSLVLLVAFRSNEPVSQSPTNAICTASKINGFYIYVDATPLRKHRLVSVITSDELNLRLRDSQQYLALRDKFIDKATEQYRNDADGLIFKFCNGCIDKVNVIKFE